MNPTINFNFPTSFQVTVASVEELTDPDDLVIIGDEKLSRDSILLTVITDKNIHWTAALSSSFGYFHLTSNGYYSCPNPNYLLAVVGGDGFLVDVDTPELYSRIPLCCPIERVIAIEDADLVIAHDNIGICAIGKTGIIWSHDSLVMDGLEVCSIQDGFVLGFGDDSKFRIYDDHFKIDLRSGKVLERFSDYS